MLAHKALSLVELLVVMAIIALITTVVIISYPENLQKQDELDLAIEELVSNIRRAQHMALATESCKGGPAKNFGVKALNETSYQLYCNKDKPLDTISLPPGITFNIIEYKKGEMQFVPPYARLYKGKYDIFVLEPGGLEIEINQDGQVKTP